MTDAPLAGRTMFISGASRGIGLAIALRAARDGANVCLVAKTAEPHPKLEGTVHTAAAELQAAGGDALAIAGDIRDEAVVADAVSRCVQRFGGIDICVNNASAIDLRPIAELPVKRYDLMTSINSRGTFVVSQACLPHLLRSENAHVLTLSPPVDLAPRWLAGHAAYTLAKYGMSILTLGLAEEQREAGVAANCLWPRTMIATAAVKNLLGGDAAMARARLPEIMADAAHAIISRPSRECTANCFIDDEVLAQAGITDLAAYLPEGTREEDLQVDIFV